MISINQKLWKEGRREEDNGLDQARQRQRKPFDRGINCAKAPGQPRQQEQIKGQTLRQQIAKDHVVYAEITDHHVVQRDVALLVVLNHPVRRLNRKEPLPP